jgi:hypothetical protein
LRGSVDDALLLYQPHLMEIVGGVPGRSTKDELDDVLPLRRTGPFISPA